MSLMDHKVVKFLRKNAMHIQAVMILLFLLGSWVFMYHDMQTKAKIEDKCGWGEEDYYCFCEKSEAMAIKNKIESMGVGEINLSGVQYVQG